MQKLAGNFSVTFRGIVFLAVSRTVLWTTGTGIEKPAGSEATVYAVHITPFFAFGVVWPW